MKLKTGTTKTVAAETAHHREPRQTIANTSAQCLRLSLTHYLTLTTMSILSPLSHILLDAQAYHRNCTDTQDTFVIEEPKNVPAVDSTAKNVQPN